MQEALDADPIERPLGTIEWSRHGVRLHVDFDNEDAWIEIDIERDQIAQRAFRQALGALDNLGLEIMEEDECPPTLVAFDRVRYYLAWIDGGPDYPVEVPC